MPVGLVVGVLAVSSSAVLARFALETATPVAVAFWRCFGGALALAPLAVREGAARRPPSRARLRQMGLSGVLLALHFALFIAALDVTTVGAAVLLATTSPVFVAIGGARFLGERVTRRAAVGIGMSLLGVAVVSLGGDGGLATGGSALLGNGMALGAAVAISGYLLIGRSARRVVPAATYSAVVYGAASGVLVVACLVLDQPLVGYSTTSWLAIAAMVAGPQLLGHTVFNTLLSRVPTTVVAVVAVSEPVLATLLAALVLAEVPSAPFWVGAPVVVAGVLLASLGATRSARTTRTEQRSAM